MGEDDRPLTGLRVLVTRPEHQADSLCRAIEQAGGVAIRLPAIEISGPSEPEELERALARSASANLVIFVSANAVAHGLPGLLRHGWSNTNPVAAVGPATARALQAAGIRKVMVPSERYDSEGLLELLPPEKVRGKKITIVRGDQGRTLLADTLAARGARVDNVICYQRRRPQNPAAPSIEKVSRGEFDVTIATSVETIENLLALTGPRGRAHVLSRPLVVVSERTRAAGQEIGFHGPILVANHASDDALLVALGAWRGSQNDL